MAAAEVTTARHEAQLVRVPGYGPTRWQGACVDCGWATAATPNKASVDAAVERHAETGS
jgi:hypothetical protein